MKVALYLRISKESSCLDNQRIVLQEYCIKMNYEIVGIYEDIISGASPKRPEFTRMLSDAAKHKFSLLLFYSLDRFSRSGTRETIRYLQMLDDYNVMYKSFTEQYIDSSGIFKDVIIALLATLAKQERVKISERVYAGLTRARQHGRFGVFNLKHGESKIEYFKEKPQGDGDDTAWINGGFFVLEPQVFDYIEGPSTVFEKQPLEKLAKDGQLNAFKHYP